MCRKPLFSKLFFYGHNLFIKNFKGGLPKVELFISYLKYYFSYNNYYKSPCLAISYGQSCDKKKSIFLF